jgi:hypothetical protein
VGLGCQQLGHTRGNGLKSRAGVGRGRCQAAPAAEKMAHDDFFHFKFFIQLNRST